MKAELRNIIRTKKRQFTKQQLGELSLDIIKKLEEHPRFKEARIVLLYYSLPDEVCTHQLIERIKGKTILLPKVTGEGTMELRQYTGRKDMANGAYGIKEPVGKTFTDYGKIELAVIPGMAFDSQCHRLGRGKGYYDRFLAQTPDIYKIGICFGFQIVEKVPVEKTDITMDCIITELSILNKNGYHKSPVCQHGD